MSPSGPQQFDLQVFDHFDTKDPAAPLVGTDIVGSTSVTLNWNTAGTALVPNPEVPNDQGVQFGSTIWHSPGNGPLKVYEEILGPALVLKGTVAWSVLTQTLSRTENDTPGQRYRRAITPEIRLYRNFEPNDGSPPSSTLVYTATDTVRGNWMPMPKEPS